jgi:hypothetical protein
MTADGVRKALHFTWIAVVIAALYVAWVFYSRHQQQVAADRELAQRKKEKEQRVDNLIFGSGEVQFTIFSADRGVLSPGSTTELCYGVVNAVKVELDPPIEAAKPTYRHCLQIAPKKTTTYTIKATDAKGNTKSQSLTIQVR